MEINKIEQDYDPWKGQSFTVASKLVNVNDGTPINPGEFKEEGEPFKVENVNQLNLKLSELGYKNELMKELAIKEGKDTYTQKFIMKLWSFKHFYLITINQLKLWQEKRKKLQLRK